MLISQHSLDQFSPTYRKAILEFEDEYSLISGTDQRAINAKKNLIIKFSENFLTPKEIWDEFFRVLYEGDPKSICDELLQKEPTEIERSNKIHFYFDDNRNLFRNLNKYLIRYRYYYHLKPRLYADDEIRPCFTYPYKELDSEYRVLAESTANPISKEEKERYLFMKDLYESIIIAEGDGNNVDDEKWFELIKKAINKQFIKDSVEYRLGKNLNNIQLWKLYIEYSKQHQSKKDLLNLYSKYCRYFLDDKEMKKEYKNAVKNFKISSTSSDNNSCQVVIQEVQKRSWLHLRRKRTKNYHCVNWKNPFSFEKYVSADLPLPPRTIKKILPPLITTFPRANFIPPNFKIYYNQIFPFSKPIMAYLLQNRSSQLLHKLHKCCKYFFAIFPFPVCHRFCGGFWKMLPATFYSCSLVIHDSNYHFNKALIISNSFNIGGRDPNLLTYVLKNLHICEAKYFYIHDQSFTLKEFKFLVGHGNAEHLNLRSIKIFRDSTFDNKNLIPLEEILSMTPKIREFEMHDPYITLETSQILSELNFQNDIILFYITSLNNIFEKNGFLAFLKKNFKQFFFIWLTFKRRNNDFHDFIKNNYRNDSKEGYSLTII